MDCLLCGVISERPVIDSGRTFCCMGCHAVFNILLTKNQLQDFQKHPIFLQALRSGLISNPALLEHIRTQKVHVAESEKERFHIEVEEMWCPACAEVIRLIVLREKGVINCTVDYATDRAFIEFAPRYISKEKILDLIKGLGYVPQSLDRADRKPMSQALYLRFGVAAFCVLNIMMFAYPLYATYFNFDDQGYGTLFAWLSFWLSLPVIFYSAWPIWRRWLAAMRVGLFGMETLVAIGVWAAFLVSIIDLLSGNTRVYFDSMAVIITFVLLGKIIEAKAKFSAKESLLRLSETIPKRCRKRFDDQTARFVLAKEVAQNDVLVAYAGEKIALDGVIVHGQGTFDESLLTGESIPIFKSKGDSVLGGTILAQGNVDFVVTRAIGDTALQQIIHTIEGDIGQKSLYVRAADRIVYWFVPIVCSIAVLAAMAYWLFPVIDDAHPAETALLRALTVLLISCPCAIGVAAPVAESYLLNSLAALGVIVRNRGCLSLLGKEHVMIFDKTGTVTEGRFTVHSGIDGLSAEEKTALSSLSMQSMHPIACAIAGSLPEQSAASMEGVEEVVGHGMRGKVNGVLYCLGSAKFLLQQGLNIEPTIQEHGSIKKNAGEVSTRLYFAKEKKCIAHLVLMDKVREEIPGMLAELKNVKKVLLSGDSEKTVEAVAALCGFDEWKAGCTPFDKRDFVEKMKCEGKTVCMVGDGINDAPALTLAHIGISVVSASDMSIQVSDILLTTDRLRNILKMRQMAQKGRKIIQQNLFWAFFYNVIGIFLAAFGVLSPIFAVFAMSISSLTVLLNARRLL